MFTIETLVEYLERVIAEDTLANNKARLKNHQISAGFLLEAARASGDKNLATRFQVLAAKAANAREGKFED